MISLVKRTYNRIVGHHFFYKLILLYAAIIIATISLLVYVILYSITNMLREQAMNYNEQVLQTVNIYFYNQNHTLKKIVNNLYTVDWNSSTQIFNSVKILYDKKSTTGDETLDQKINALPRDIRKPNGEYQPEKGQHSACLSSPPGKQRRTALLPV